MKIWFSMWANLHFHPGIFYILDLRHHFFSESERVIDRWNGLDQCVINSVTMNQDWLYGERDKTRWASSMPGRLAPHMPHLVLKILFRNRCGRIW